MQDVLVAPAVSIAECLVPARASIVAIRRSEARPVGPASSLLRI
jgi:hypothetical protein